MALPKQEEVGPPPYSQLVAKLFAGRVSSLLLHLTNLGVEVHASGQPLKKLVDQARVMFNLQVPYFPRKNGECFKNVRTRIQSLSERKHGCLILPRPVDTECAS